MNKKLQCAFLTSVVLALVACGKADDEQDKRNSQAALSQEFVKRTEEPKSDGTVGMLLPDFAQLVAREGGAVVNIQAVSERSNHNGQSQGRNIEDPFSDFFRRMIPNAPENMEDEANFGSGVIISVDGYVLTNAHVVKGMTRIKVGLNDKREYTAKLIGADEKSDIALLKIEAGEALPVAKIGNPNELKSGEWVAAIGAPFGFDNSVTAGIVSAKNRTLPDENYTPFIQTDVAINPGNSGGPLFNLKGQVVGINSQIYSRSGGFMGISFAIPIDVAMNVAEQLKATGKVERGQLGVVIQEVSYDLAKSFGLDKPTGALVAKIMPNSPAAQAGLQVGDIIRSVNGENVRASSDLPLTIGSIAPGQEVRLGIWRKGKLTEIRVTLAAQHDIMAQQQYGTERNMQAGNIAAFNVPAAGLSIVVHANADGEQALVVAQVTGIAAQAGLRRGDVIEEVAGKRVNNQESFEMAIQQAGKNIPLLVNRGGNTIFMAMILP